MIPATHPSGRGLAAEILTAWEAGRHTASELLDLHLKEAVSHGQGTDLVYGVIRRRALLDQALTAVAKVKIAHLEKDLLALLRLGVYELLFCPDTAEYGILNDLGDLAGRNKKRRGFVNAVLRTVQRAVENRKSPAEGADLRRWVPARPHDGCLLKEPIFPDPKTRPEDYYSTVYSLPRWLVGIWLKTYGTETLRQICQGCGRTPEIILQPNTLKTNAVRLAEILKSEAVLSDLNADKTMLRIHTRRYLKDLWAFQKGFFLVQDPSAAKVVALMEPKIGATALDLCAAPGGKTMQIAMAMHDQGKVIASDSDSRRLRKVEENQIRLGITCVRCVPPEGIKEALGSKNKVQSVLLDVPCSNTGVMARRAEVRWRLRPESIAPLVKTQKTLLEQAAGFVRKRGTLAYSTCSILPEENENQVKEFLRVQRAFSLDKEELTLPSCGGEGFFAHDGGYVAILRKG